MARGTPSGRRGPRVPGTCENKSVNGRTGPADRTRLPHCRRSTIGRRAFFLGLFLVLRVSRNTRYTLLVSDTHTHTRHARARRLTHVDPRRTARRRAMTGRDNARVTYLIIERQSAGTRTDIGRRGIGRPSRRGKSKDFCE